MNPPPKHFKRIRTGRSVEALKEAYTDNLFYVAGRTFAKATPLDHYSALAYTIRDRLLERFIDTAQNYKRQSARTVAYLSAEFLSCRRPLKPGPWICSSDFCPDTWRSSTRSTPASWTRCGCGF